MTQGAREILKHKVSERIEEKRHANDRYLQQQKLAHDAEQQALNRQNERKIARQHDIATIVGQTANGVMKGAMNDPEWYKRYIKDVEPFVRIPTYDRIGSHYFGRLFSYSKKSTSDIKQEAIPGIMTFRWYPTVGLSTQSSNTHARDPINQTLARCKEKVLALNSRSSTNWEAADLGYNFMCTADILSVILDLGRVIRVYQTYHSKNAYFAQALIEALHWDYNDVVTNYAEYRKAYLKFARKFNSAIVAPLDLSLYARRAYLASNIFSDSDDPKVPHQIYAFVQQAMLRLDNDAIACSIHKLLNYSKTLTFISSTLDTAFQRITDNPDFIEMYQDLRHAFGSRLIEIPVSIEGEEQPINTVKLNREQIQNMMICPIYADVNQTRLFASPYDVGGGWGLHTDTDGYLYQPRVLKFPNLYSNILNTAFGSNKLMGELFGAGTMTKLLNMFVDAPNGDDILDITRLNYSLEFPSSGTDCSVLDCGTEFISESFIYFYKHDIVADTISLSFHAFSTYEFSFLVDVETIRRTTAWTVFDWAPIHTECTQFDTSGNFYVQSFVDAYTSFTITGMELRRINEVAVMSEFYVPDSAFGSWH